jgi:phosphoglycolate phosphatase-like HAD superfamily hydrolase
MADTKQKIVVCDIDGTIADARDRVAKYLYEGYRCDECGREESFDNLQWRAGSGVGINDNGKAICGKHEGMGMTCRGRMVNQEKDWNGFYGAVGEDKPMVSTIRMLQELHKLGFKVVFVTGRNESCRVNTVEWLKRHLGTTEFDLYMRAEYDRQTGKKVKRAIVSNLLDPKDVAFIFEDDVETIEMYRELCPNATIVDTRHYLFDDGSVVK